MLLAIIPFVPLIFALGGIMSGEVWDWALHGCNNNDPNCYRSVFDVFTLEGVMK